MTSNTLAGERRWASARRVGMTVLGKVAVPKPLNLPSQRLENHGLDPNVEIVPKGTLSWGSRSSSSASNPWGSLALSPTGDGSSGSPSQLSGRPSSGGSGTRPSTAGSDRTHEPTGGAWGPNSRPSSASGVLTSSQTSLTPSRPHTAETRPGSSQLSRFAGTSSDNSVAWGASGTAEKLGLSSSKNDGFSLSTGDFPTLGSEKDTSGKNTESQDHGSYSRPGSSSGGVATTKDRNISSPVGSSTCDVSVNSNVNSGTVDTWKRDSSQHVEDAVYPSSGKWHGEPQHYLNANVPPQHFDAWRGPPINAPGVWYRGPPGGPPYGTPIPPGGYPIEPYPPYRFQVPPPALTNSQPVPPQGVGPRGPHPNNGDFHRPHGPDAFVHPQMRPGFYPDPVPYEGYYGPPMGYCHPGDRNMPFMGMPPGPAHYNRYQGQNGPDPNSNYGRAGGHGSSGKTVGSDQAGHPDDTRGPYKVLLKQSNEHGGKEEEGKWEHKKVEDVSLRTFDNRGGYSSDSGKAKISGSRGNFRAVDEGSVKKSENVASALPESPHVVQPNPKDSTLIQKIEGLNAKARTSDGRHDVSIPGREEQKNRLQVNVKAGHSANIASTGAVSKERTPAAGDVISACHGTNKTLHPAAGSVVAISRGAGHGVEGRLDHRGKSFNAQDADGWRKKPLAAESANVIVSANIKPTSNLHVHDQHASMEAAEKSEIYPQGNDEEESMTPIFDPHDSQAQRAKMREIAKQRAKQLQEEEEERTREQKAKALAKLEELNRRMQVADCLTQKSEKVPPSGDTQKEHGESETPVEPAMVDSKYEKPSSASVSDPSVVAQASDKSTIEGGESTILSGETLVETPDNSLQKSVVQHGQSLSSQEGVHSTGAADFKTTRQVSGSSVSRQKRVGYKPKHSVTSEKSFTEKSVPISTTETPIDHTEVAVDDVTSIKVVIGEISLNCDSSSSISPSVTVESSAQQRRKNSKSSKNKQKLEETPPVTAPPSLPQNDINPDVKNVIQPVEQRSMPSDEAHGRLSNHLKPQHSRRMPRAPQGNRPADKFHGSDTVKWAPVKPPQNKSEVMDEASLKTVSETVTPTVKSDNLVQNSLKSKRAEMERYVPKPKELAQQGSTQQPGSSSTNQTPSDEAVGRTEPALKSTESSQSVSSAVGNVGSATESKNGGVKHSKQSKAHGSWRQRGSTESTYAQGAQDVSSFSSNPEKNVQKPIQQHQSVIPTVQSVKGQENISGEWGDGWNIPDYPETAVAVSTPVLKDQGVSGRGKRHQSKSHRSTGSNYDQDRRNTNNVDADRSYGQSAPIETSQADKVVAFKENRGVEERAPHWQPKSQAHFVHNRGNRSSGGQNVTEVGKAVKYKDTGEVDVQSEQKNVAEAASEGHQGAKRERKAPAFRGRTNSPNQGHVNTAEHGPGTVDTRHEPRNSSGFRRNGNQNNRMGRENESGGDWSSGGHDNEQQHNAPANRDRQRYNSHYEYQPKSNNFEGPRDGSYNNTGSRYNERGQGQSRRGGGNFYGRQSGNVRVDAGYE